MNHMPSSITIVCYDITNNKLRSQIDKCMKDFGIRLQFSVFLCRLDANGVKRCREKLLNLLEVYKDKKAPGDSLIIFERFNPSAADCLLGKHFMSDSAMYAIY